MDNRSLTRNTLIYLPFKLIEGAAGVITLNRLTSMFSTEAYSGFVTVNTAVNLGYLILVAWLSNAAGRYILQLDNSGKRSEHYFSTFAAFLAIVAPCVAVLSACGLIFEEYRSLFLLGAGMFFSYSLFQLATVHLVRLGRVKAFSAVSLINALLKPALSILFFSISRGAGDISLALTAYIIADLSMGLAAVILLHPPALSGLKSISLQRCLTYAKYGLPLIGTGIGLGLLNMSDRFLVGLFAGKTGLAVYSANYSIASVVFAMLMGGIMRGVYPPIIASFGKNGREGALPLLNRGVELYIMFALPSAFGIAALSPRISALMFERPEYASGNMVAGIVALAMFFWGLSEYSNKAFELEGNTKSIFAYSLSAAALNILLNALTLRVFGFYAAAINTLLAFVFYFVLSYLGARKQFVFNLGLKTWGTYIFAAALCGGAAFGASFLIESHPAAIIIGTLSGAMVYAALLAAFGRLKFLLKDLVK